MQATDTRVIVVEIIPIPVYSIVTSWPEVSKFKSHSVPDEVTLSLPTFYHDYEMEIVMVGLYQFLGLTAYLP